MPTPSEASISTGPPPCSGPRRSRPAVAAALWRRAGPKR